MKKRTKLSQRFIIMRQEVNNLRKLLLPRNFDPTGNYTERVFQKTYAYKLLVHAEFESYPEERAKEAAIEAINNLEQRQKLSKVLLGLLAFSGNIMDHPPSTKLPQKLSSAEWAKKTDILEKIKIANTNFMIVINNNHGIKEENILKILLPLGIDIGLIDNVLIANLNSFGSSRGFVAHNSASMRRLKQQPDPKTELKNVQFLLNEFQAIDKIITELLL